MKCFERAKDNVAASNITIENEVEMDEKEEKDEISIETAFDVVDKSLQLFDCSPIKHVCQPDRTLQIGKWKISKVTNAFSKAVAIALDGPVLGQSTDCSNCCQLVELLSKNLLSLKIGEKLFNFKPLFLVTYQSLKLQKFSTFQSTLQGKLVN